MSKQLFGASHRHAVIADLASKLTDRSPQFGRTVLMKLLYLLQEVYSVPLGYRFSFYSYGPYSAIVLNDLEQVSRQGGVEIYQLTEDNGGYEIGPGPNLDTVREGGDEELNRYRDPISDLVQQFGGFRAKELELRTSVIYLSKNLPRESSEIADDDALIETVRELKPQFSESEIGEVVQELRQARLIS